MNKKMEEFKADFYRMAEEYQLPVRNKADFYYKLSMRIEENTDNRELYQLLLDSIGGSDFLLSHFLPPMSKKEVVYEYKNIKKKIVKLDQAVLDERNLAREWEEIKRRKTLPDVKGLSLKEVKRCEMEAKSLCSLYKKYVSSIPRGDSELYNNLFCFCRIVRKYSRLRKIAPFFFWETMVKHSKRLAGQKGFQFSLKKLWEYKEYRICKDNGKNYRQYKAYVKLFVTLCRDYKMDETVNIQLCRYAFAHSSNIIQWLHEFYPQKAKKCQSRLWTLLDHWVSCWDPYIPEEYDICGAYHVSWEEWQRYFAGNVSGNEPDYSGALLEMEDFIMEYIIEHIEYLLVFMENLYINSEPIFESVQKIYDDAELAERYPMAVPVNCRMSHVHGILMKCLELGVKTKIEGAFSAIIESNSSVFNREP